MTAVAPPPNLQSVNRSGWSGSNGQIANNGLNMSADDVSRMLMPRKTAQRTNSSSSLNSLASSSSTSTISAASSSVPQSNGDWGSRKRTTRGIWQPSKSEPIAGISTARPQSVNSATSGPSAASTISALHNPNNMSQHQNGGHLEVQQGGAVVVGKARQIESNAVLYLTPMNGTFERKTINVPFYPDVLRIGRQTNNKTMPTPMNGYFDSKVLSRQHAEIWADRNGKIWIRDVKSSNGTFVNGQRLSQENKDSDPHELREQDMLELGIDIVSEDQKTVVHHKVAARVEHAGFYNPNNGLDLNFGDMDPQANSGIMANNVSQSSGQMRRTPSSSSINSNGRMSVASAASTASNMQQRAPHFWLAPVNMDKIIQKLNAECKAAKQQSLDLQRAQQHIDAFLAAENQKWKKDALQKTSTMEKTKGKDGFKSHFPDPPAPPPQAPLPEKPLFSPALLNRSDTERPRGLSKTISSTSEVVANSSQLTNLMDQLAKARQEVEIERARLRETEDLLVQERVRREDAEERAKRLESAASETQLSAPHPLAKNEESTSSVREETQDYIDTKKLQERFDLLLAEFNEYKTAAIKWKLDRDQAEKERDEERTERKTLAELVEQLRAEEAARLQKEEKKRSRRLRRSRSKSVSIKKARDALEGSVAGPEFEEDENEAFLNGSLEKKNVANGHPTVYREDHKGSDANTYSLQHRDSRLADTAPYLSAISVVMIGVAVMALLNKIQRGESPAG